MVGTSQLDQAKDNACVYLHAADNIAAGMLKREKFELKELHLQDGGICCIPLTWQHLKKQKQVAAFCALAVRAPATNGAHLPAWPEIQLKFDHDCISESHIKGPHESSMGIWKHLSSGTCIC